MVSNHVGARDSGIRQNEQQVIRKIAHGKCNSSPHPFFVALARWALREASGSGREGGDESSLETVRKGGCTTYFPEQLCVLFSGNYVCDMNSRFFVFIPYILALLAGRGGHSTSTMNFGDKTSTGRVAQ